MMTDHLASTDLVVSSYMELRSRVSDLLRSTPEQSGDLMVPACPEWNIRQLLSHMVGVPEDILTGNMEGVTTQAWTAAQVARHSGKSLDELAESYELTGQVFDDVLPRIASPMNSQMVMDAVTHELDLREALGDNGARSSSAVGVALSWLRFAFETRFPANTFDSIDVDETNEYELLRCLTGRRTRAELDAFGLDGAAIVEVLSGTPIAPPI